MRTYEIKPHLQEILSKLAKKDKALYERVLQKIEEVIHCRDIDHYKNLRYDLKDRKRVHVGHFVLVFNCAINEDKVSFLDFGHHDDIYARK